jgi:hypothetical protein
MAWDKYPSSNGTFNKEVIVTRFARAPHDDGAPSEPLPEYLRLCANVAYDLQYSMTNIPMASRLTFEEAGTALLHGDAAAKLDAMMMATRQASLRQEAAEQWRKVNQHGPLQSRDSSSLSESMYFDESGMIEVERDTELPPAAGPLPVPPDVPSQGRATSRLKLPSDSPRLCRPGPIRPVTNSRLQSGLQQAGPDSSPMRLMSSPLPQRRQLPEPFGTPRGYP